VRWFESFLHPPSLRRFASAIGTNRRCAVHRAQQHSLQPRHGKQADSNLDQPMYSSACGWRAARAARFRNAAERESEGPLTTGFGENLMAASCLKLADGQVNVVPLFLLHDMSSSITFAPTEKFVASLVMTKASNHPRSPASASADQRNNIGAKGVHLEWNSMQPTPSPSRPATRRNFS